jgi:hypothetical protein
MSTVSTEHRGYAIVYSELTNNWNVPDLDLTVASLKQAKGRIDEALLQMARIDNVPVLIRNSAYSIGFAEAKVTRADGVDWWVTYTPPSRSIPVRQKMDSRLVHPDTPEVREIFRLAIEASDEATRLRRVSETLVAALPLFSVQKGGAPEGAGK